ncbi:immunoglobulin superfamily member 11 isoform X1 [Nerophis ophidion]|uniref:immunoglobulin superfamily member 11 isoform X1 n=1 Tax=Nerophis ophidion TaxID=159077 RepID=UPI002ADF975D|nr:immunoglobulin superfamily member 11 isoform X1 [Nerophis ophidion]XP_061754513.1 immunoglobulin superfamily member 11 isoform X1 [Nerophis ophidion]XP_061754514.1 immunoglobulin superfamily member 11 isoform X1 [Nerophis ophidion]XP_061754515.1 immunoglobulin superfamily member 11 isoform X1 [Nerophis ophidion]
MASSGGCTLWNILSVCFTALQTSGLVVTVKESTIEVVRGDFVILPCSFFTSSPLSRLNIIWTLAPFSSPYSPIQVIVFDHGQIIEDTSLIGRVAFTAIPLSGDIMVNDTRVSDAGVYRCMVNNPPETADPGIGELVLRVLVAPSLPACEWEGEMVAGGSVTLSCSVAEGIPSPDIHWDKLNPEEISLPINMEDDLSGSVQIVNVSSQTSGLYRCSASNVLGTENCYVNLSVYSALAGNSSGILQGVLLTLSMALMLLALLLLSLWLHRTGHDGRWKTSEEEEEEGYNEIRYTPSLIKRSFV